MLKIRSVTFHNFDCWRDFTLSLDPYTNMITGPNGSGKTSFIDGIRLAFNAPRLSSGRRLSDYIGDRRRRTVVKLVVENPKEGRGYAFSSYRSINSDIVSIGCAVIYRDGAPKRRFFIIPGDASMDVVRRVVEDEKEYLPANDYSEYLARAGVSRALMDLLAIEQGETHRFCQKTPRELFLAVLQAMGDQGTLESYHKAKLRYEEAEQVLRDQRGQLNVEEGRLIDLTRRKEEYERFEALQGRLAVLKEQELPLASLAARMEELTSVIESNHSSRGLVASLETRLRDLNEQLNSQVERQAEGDRALASARLASEEARGEHDRALTESAQSAAKRAILETEEEAVKAIQPLDPAALQKAYDEADAAVATVRAARTAIQDKDHGLREEIAQLEKGLSAHPSEVRAFTRVLGREGIPHSLLADLVEIESDEWRVAVESVLGADRFTVLVEPAQSVAAREHARRERYRFYVSELEAGSRPLRATPGSLLEEVTFLDRRVPSWVAEELNRVGKVRTVADGYAAVGSGAWAAAVTPDAYFQNRRGGRCIEVPDHFCGTKGRKVRLAAARRALEAAVREGERLAALLEEAVEKRKAADRAMLEQQRRLEWAARGARQLAETRAAERALLDRTRQSEARLSECRAVEEKLVRASGETEARIDFLRSQVSDLDRNLAGSRASLDQGLSRQADLERQVALIKASLPAALGTPERIAAARDLRLVQAEVDEVASHVDTFQGCRDPDVPLQWKAQRQARDDLRNHVDRCGQEVADGRRELDHCRQDYLRVVAAVFERYRRNVRELGEIAGFTFRLHLEPELADNDQVLEKIELKAEVSVDGAAFRPINTARLSGGQRVIASLTLLMALSDQESRTGLFILDEPFAHLSTERIDEVAQFINAVQAQFILTTPVTENATVLSTARRLIIMQIKPSAELLAPLPYLAVAAPEDEAIASVAAGGTATAAGGTVGLDGAGAVTGRVGDKVADAGEGQGGR